ncbi:hypothetical protein [Enhygromyxa salina]|nr:hypothetical protein [Enhygromyxa salina]
MLFWSAGLVGLLLAPLFLVTPGIVVAWLAAPLAFGLGHWIGDRFTRRQEGHVAAKMLSRAARYVHGTAIVLGTCSYYPLVLPADQDGVSLQPVFMLAVVLFALALSASTHTARRRGWPLMAASFSATTYAAIAVLIGVFSGAMWIGGFALPFAMYFAASALWLLGGPRWHDA